MAASPIVLPAFLLSGPGRAKAQSGALRTAQPEAVLFFLVESGQGPFDNARQKAWLLPG
jgi:hypothetical protein